jgi:hypothetical protein
MSFDSRRRVNSDVLPLLLPIEEEAACLKEHHFTEKEQNLCASATSVMMK